MGRSVKVIDQCRKTIEAAGSSNVQEAYFELPIGTWPKNRRLKEAGRIQFTAWTGGLDGFLMFFLTKFGEYGDAVSCLALLRICDSTNHPVFLGSPQPWTVEEVLAYTAKMREEFNDRKNHIYHYT